MQSKGSRRPNQTFRSFLGLRQRFTRTTSLQAAAVEDAEPTPPDQLPKGASTDLAVIFRRLRKVRLVQFDTIGDQFGPRLSSSTGA